MGKFHTKPFIFLKLYHKKIATFDEKISDFKNYIIKRVVIFHLEAERRLFWYMQLLDNSPAINL
jgi:hypothetical protein